MDLEPTTTLFRCSECGKWSHAKRRRVWHKRFIASLDPDETPEADEHGWIEDGVREDGRTRCDASAQASDWELPVIDVRDETAGEAVVINRHGDLEPDPWVDLGGVVVKCGPFVAYSAIMALSPMDDPVARNHARRLSAEAAEDRPVRRARLETTPASVDDIPF